VVNNAEESHSGLFKLLGPPQIKGKAKLLYTGTSSITRQVTLFAPPGTYFPHWKWLEIDEKYKGLGNLPCWAKVFHCRTTFTALNFAELPDQDCIDHGKRPVAFHRGKI